MSTTMDTTDLDTFLATLRDEVLAEQMTLDQFRWFANLGDDKRKALMNNVDDEVEQVPTSILRRISAQPLMVAATDGTATIPKAGDVFTGYIDSDFTGWSADEASDPTLAMPTALYEMAQDATFAQMFGSLSAQTESLCMTQSQIIEWVKSHRVHLRTDGYATFFIFKSKGSFFVAYVYFDVHARLRVYVSRFVRGDVWYAEYRLRVVVPQL